MKHIFGLLCMALLLQAPARASEPDPVVGGYWNIDVTQPEVIGAAYFAVAKLSEGGVNHQLVRILKAESQVVAGINYRLTLELIVGGVSEVHEVVVYTQPWIHSWALISDQILGA